MAKKEAVSYYVLVYQQGDSRQVTCNEVTPQGFKQMKKLFKQVVYDTIAQDPTETEFGQLYLVPESGQLNSAPCISSIQIKRWREAALAEFSIKDGE